MELRVINYQAVKPRGLSPPQAASRTNNPATSNACTAVHKAFKEHDEAAHSICFVQRNVLPRSFYDARRRRSRY